MPRGPDHPPVISTEEARQAKPVGRMRYVLIFGIVLTLIGFAIAYLVIT
jgi:hypothetical protein